MDERINLFRENIRRFRKARRLTQVQLAQVLGYNYTAIANYESGRNTPSINNLIKLADFFRVSIDELVGHEVNTSNSALYPMLDENEKVFIDGVIMQYLEFKKINEKMIE